MTLLYNQAFQKDACDRTTASKHAVSSVHILDMSLAPALRKLYIQVLSKALAIACLAHTNDPTRADGSARLIYSLTGRYN